MTEKRKPSSNVTPLKTPRQKDLSGGGTDGKINFEESIDDFIKRTNANGYEFPHTYSDNKKKRRTIANVKFLFKHYGITVNYDELLKKQTVVLNNSHDLAHTDLIDNSQISNISSLLSLNGMSDNAFSLMSALFAENASNPVLDWITSKPWDKKDRLSILSNTLNVSKEDQHYRDIALRTWLIQCVAAADGARQTPNKDAIQKFELIFILQGGQGVKKTSWFKRLVPKEFNSYILDGAHLDPADKESVRICISTWICELGELDSTFRRADIARLKAFLSKQTDTIRLPYDRAPSPFGRRTSFCGSVNPEQFLTDSTGARRFLPVQVLACDSLHTIDMQQLWAQVWHYYLEGRQWWCSGELEKLLEERHGRHSEINPLHEMIAGIFNIERIEKQLNHEHYTATKILIECGIKDPKPAHAKSVSEFLNKCGFTQQQSKGVRGFWLEKWPFKAYS